MLDGRQVELTGWVQLAEQQFFPQGPEQRAFTRSSTLDIPMLLSFLNPFRPTPLMSCDARGLGCSGLQSDIAKEGPVLCRRVELTCRRLSTTAFDKSLSSVFLSCLDLRSEIEAAVGPGDGNAKWETGRYEPAPEAAITIRDSIIRTLRVAQQRTARKLAFWTTVGPRRQRRRPPLAISPQLQEQAALPCQTQTLQTSIGRLSGRQSPRHGLPSRAQEPRRRLKPSVGEDFC